MVAPQSKLLPVLLVVVMFVVFGAGVFVGMKLAPQQVAASPGPVGGMSGCSMNMGGGGGCGMMSGGKEAQAGGGCPMMSGGKDAGKPSGKPAAATTAPKADAKAKAAAKPKAVTHESAAHKPAQPKAAKAKAAAEKPAPKSASADVYICPMCPDVKSDKPGQCPKCHMDLVKKG